jgi:lysophospholipase L1-like esterase
MHDVWTTAHLTALSPEGDLAFAFVPQPRDFVGRTVRQTLRLRRGGTALRLVVSNEYGATPLVIDQLAAIATAGRPVPLLLDGRDRWQVEPGASAVSDPAALVTATGQEVQVDAYLTGPVPAAGHLHSAQRTGQHAPGNQVGRPRLTGAETFASHHWITRVQVDSPARGPVVVAFGDSITRGDATSDDLDQRYPDHLQRRLLAAGAAEAVVLNAGIGGNRLLAPGYGPSMTERLARDVLRVAEATHVIVMGGINDLGAATFYGERPPSADAIADGLFALARRAADHGVRPLLGTLTPFGTSIHASYTAEVNEVIRRGVNERVRAQRTWPVADFAAAVADPRDAGALAAAFDSGDGVHPGDAGARALAEAVDLTAVLGAGRHDPTA